MTFWDISLDILKLTNPLLPMMPVSVVDPCVETNYQKNVDGVKDSKKSETGPVSSRDNLSNADEHVSSNAERKQSKSQEGDTSKSADIDDASSEHSEIPIKNSN